MSSKKIAYHSSGRDNESYVFLDRSDEGVYSVRSGTSLSTSHMTWGEDFSIQTVEEFLLSHPAHTERVNQLIAEFESESNQ
ncbi:hypothetical protein L3N86_001277 [Salmonella enterica subsp. enterica serovar Stanleyville]|nr:hypothetical protein [Salmonella enterica subsp. enterica serovar Stanleyville]